MRIVFVFIISLIFTLPSRALTGEVLGRETCIAEKISHADVNRYFHSYFVGNALFPQFNQGIVFSLLSAHLRGDFRLEPAVEAIQAGYGEDQMALAMNRMHAAHGVNIRTPEAAGPEHNVVQRFKLMELLKAFTSLEIKSALRLIDAIEPDSEAKAHLSKLVGNGFSRETRKSAAFIDNYLENNTGLKSFTEFLSAFMNSQQVAKLGKDYKTKLMSKERGERQEVSNQCQAELTAMLIIEMKKAFPSLGEGSIVRIIKAIHGNLELSELQKRCPYLKLL